MNDYIYLVNHYLLNLIIIFGPFLIPVRFLKYYIIFFLLIIFHWYFNNGKCILSQMHTKETDDKDFMIYLFDKFNIPHVLFDLFVYFIIFVCFYRINNLMAGFNIIIIILILNLLVYKRLFFKY
mgnify:CR=1 FL=1